MVDPLGNYRKIRRYRFLLGRLSYLTISISKISNKNERVVNNLINVVDNHCTQ